MRWLERLFRKPTEPDKTDAAFEYGRRVAQTMADQLEAFASSRFEHIKVGYLAILSGNFDAAVVQVEHSPLVVARADFSYFNEQVADARQKLRSEIKAEMSEWSEVATMAGIGDKLNELAEAKLDGFAADMQASGLRLLMDRAEEIKAADDAWRLQFPDRAAKEPQY